MKIKLYAGLFVALMLTPFSTSAMGPNDVLDRDMKLMLSWFEGRYDNVEQTYFQKLLGVKEENRHERIHSIFKRVDLPEIGKNVYYVQQYIDNDPQNVYRQRIYIFEPVYDRNAIGLNIMSFKDAKAVLNAHEEPEKLAGLKMDDLSAMPAGCRVYWQRQANQFIGFMDKDACRIESKRSGKTIIITDDLVLTEEEIWIRDQAVDSDGNYVFGNKAGIHHKLLKARPMTCWFSVKNEQAKSGWDFASGLEVHDQGGEAWITTTGDNPKKYGIRLRNVRWPYGNNTDAFVIYAHEEGNPKAISYSWAEKTANRVGLNLRWMQASCSNPDL